MVGAENWRERLHSEAREDALVVMREALEDIASTSKELATLRVADDALARCQVILRSRRDDD